jgi:opine dehydrogenase
MLVGLQDGATSNVHASREIDSLAVIGAGPIGQAVACAAAASGKRVALHSAFTREAQQLLDGELITVRGGGFSGDYRFASAAHSEAPVIHVEQALERAVGEVEAVVLAVPTFTQATYAGLLARMLHRDQLLVLMPGGTFGAIEVARVLRRHRAASGVAVVELAATPHVVTSAQPGVLEVVAERRSVAAAAIPHAATAGAVRALLPVLPMLRGAAGVLETSFSNTSGLLVAAPALLAASAPGNATLRDRLPGSIVESLLARLDAERARTAFAFGVRELRSLAAWLGESFGTQADDPVLALDEVGAYDSLPAPGALDIAVHDAVLTGLVPLVSAAELAGVAAPATAALVALASAISGIDLAAHGRTMASLGLERLRIDEIRRALEGAADAVVVREVLV